MENISETVEQFCAKTGITNKEKARSLIASCGGDLEKAVNLHRDGFEEKPSKPGKDTISSKGEELQLAIQASLGPDTEGNHLSPYYSENAEEEAYPGEFDKSYNVVWTSDEEEDEEDEGVKCAALAHPKEDEPRSEPEPN